MGVLSDLVVADRSQARRIAEAAVPSQAFGGADVKGIDSVKLATLHEVLTGRAFEELLPEYDPVEEVSEEGPWVFALPDELVAGLARLSPGERSAVAARWARTEEFDGWDLASVSEALNIVCEQAGKAAGSGRTLFLWMCL